MRQKQMGKPSSDELMKQDKLKDHIISHKRYLDITQKYTITNKDNRLFLMEMTESQGQAKEIYEKTIKSTSGAGNIIKNESSLNMGS